MSRRSSCATELCNICLLYTGSRATGIKSIVTGDEHPPQRKSAAQPCLLLYPYATRHGLIKQAKVRLQICTLIINHHDSLLILPVVGVRIRHQNATNAEPDDSAVYTQKVT